MIDSFSKFIGSFSETDALSCLPSDINWTDAHHLYINAASCPLEQEVLVCMSHPYQFSPLLPPSSSPSHPLHLSCAVKSIPIIGFRL